MKKIVALVLSLVMVLGLATTAMAAPIVGDYEFVLTNDKDEVRYAIESFEKVAAVTPVDANENGIYDETGDTVGEMSYFTVYAPYYSGGTWSYVQVKTIDDADIVVYVEDATVPYMYLAALPAGTAEYLTGAVKFDDFGTACGQYKYVDYDAEDTYYNYYGAIYVADAVSGDTNLKVGKDIVTASLVGFNGWVDHTPVYTQNDKGVVTAISCAKCTDVGVIVANYSALPTAVKTFGLENPVPGSASKYFYWVDAAVEAPEATDKVESAQTFDAGIAMYVGMSVMAAAGSAVVLKKKD